MSQEMLELCPTCRGTSVDPAHLDEETCEPCSGSGILGEVTCDLCDGRGCARCNHSGSFFNIECPHCEAQGIVRLPVRCSTCRGRKTIIPNRIINK